MARAQRTTEIVRQPKRVKRVQLTLTEGEADFLLALMAHVGGDQKKSPRKYAIRIREALSRALGIDYKGTDAYQLSEGRIKFSDYADPKAGSETTKPQHIMNIHVTPKLDVQQFNEAMARWRRAYSIRPGRTGG